MSRYIDVDAVKVRYRGGFHDDYVVDYDSFMKAPSIEIPTWIPCSERMPKQERATYLICTDGGYMCSCRWTNDRYGLGATVFSMWGWNLADVPQYSEVVAWMPLEPWKGADDETD